MARGGRHTERGGALILAVVLASGIAAHGQEQVVTDVAIPMRDGEALAATVIRPALAGVGAVVVMTPYDRRRLPDLLARTDLGFGPAYWSRWAWVLVDWRGFFESRSAAQGAAPSLADQGADGHAVVEWTARQPWSSGRVAMWGPSASGRVQFETAALRPPHLAAIVPVAAPYGYGYEQFFAGGVMRKAYVDVLDGAYGSLRRTLQKHKTEDSYWKAVEGQPTPRSIDVPVLLITGWYDLFPEDVFQTFRDLRDRGGPRTVAGLRLLIGPWTHTLIGGIQQGDLLFPAAEGASGAAATAFLARWLDDVPEPPGALPVRYYQEGSNAWRESAEWPPGPGPLATFYLRGDGGLSLTAPADDETRTFTHDATDPSPTRGGRNIVLATNPVSVAMGAGPTDQRGDVEGRDDGLLYTTPVLTQAVTVDGPVRARVFISASRRDVALAARLTDVHPDGRSILVTDGILRAKFRDSFARAAPLRRGKVYDVTVRLGTTGHTFLPGHRIRLILTGANHPRFAVVPRVPAFRRRPLRVGLTVHSDPDAPSALTLRLGPDA